MKIGFRKPSLMKSIKARTTGQAKRAVKKAIIPAYSKKGTGFITNPKKAVYNSVYNKTTIGARDVVESSKKETFIEQYQRNINIVNECANTMSETTKPDIFFSRISLYFERLTWLADNENRINLNGTPPSEMLNKRMSIKLEATTKFIDNYYNSVVEKIDSLKSQKAKLNNCDKFKTELSKYNYEMEKESIEYYQNKYDDLITKYK